MKKIIPIITSFLYISTMFSMQPQPEESLANMIERVNRNSIDSYRQAVNRRDDSYSRRRKIVSVAALCVTAACYLGWEKVCRDVSAYDYHYNESCLSGMYNEENPEKIAARKSFFTSLFSGIILLPVCCIGIELSPEYDECKRQHTRYQRAQNNWYISDALRGLSQNLTNLDYRWTPSTLTNADREFENLKRSVMAHYGYHLTPSHYGELDQMKERIIEIFENPNQRRRTNRRRHSPQSLPIEDAASDD